MVVVTLDVILAPIGLEEIGGVTEENGGSISSCLDSHSLLHHYHRLPGVCVCV